MLSRGSILRRTGRGEGRQLTHTTATTDSAAAKRQQRSDEVSSSQTILTADVALAANNVVQ